MSSYQSNEIKLINTSLIDPHPDNPRKNIGDVNDLAASIKTNGLLTPLSVVPNGERYRVIAGHRRLAACKQAGIRAVPCFVLQLGPLQQLEAMVTENCQREQLTVLEEADAIQGMLDLGATTASVAYRLGRSADYVRDRAKAASIKTEVRASRDDFGQISIGQLVAIARYDGQPDRQKELAQAAGTSNFDYILRRIERDDSDRQWVESVAALLVEPDSGINLIPDPEKPYSDPEWRYIGCMFPSTGTPEETIEKIRKLNPQPYPSTRSRSRSTSGPAATRPPTPKRKPDEPPNKPNATPAGTRSRNTPPHQQTSAWHGSTAISTASNATSSSKPRPGSDSCRSSTRTRRATRRR